MYDPKRTCGEFSLSFGLVISTKMMCTNMNIEKAFINCLAQCETYKITDDKLVLYDKTRAELMVCSSLID